MRAYKPGSPRPALDDRIFRLFVQSVKDYAIFILGPRGRIMTWNPGAETMKGYQASEVIGRTFDLFYTEEDRRNERPWALLRAAAQDGRVEDEGWRVRKDGTHFWADVIITALYSDSGDLQGYAKITRDLTERRLGEEDLRRAQQMLEQRVAERTRELQEMNEILAEKNIELEQFAEVVVGRELKTIALEKRVQELEELVRELRSDPKRT